MSETDPTRQDELFEVLQSLNRRVYGLTVTVAILVLGVLLLAVYVLGDLVNYYGGDALMFGGTSVGSGLIGFACGWFARRKR